jgi:hypothetical protein
MYVPFIASRVCICQEVVFFVNLEEERGIYVCKWER